MSGTPDPWGLERATAAAKALLRALSFSRARCYRAVFSPDAMTHDHQAVLADLRDFCFAQRSVFSSDTATTQRNIGRQEVWMRIRQHLALTDDQVHSLKAVEIDDGIG